MMLRGFDMFIMLPKRVQRLSQEFGHACSHGVRTCINDRKLQFLKKFGNEYHK